VVALAAAAAAATVVVVAVLSVVDQFTNSLISH
jgi:hypothetical protein